MSVIPFVVLGLLVVSALWLAAIWAGKDTLSSKLWQTGTLAGAFFLGIIILYAGTSGA